MPSWDPNQYLKFTDHRLRPALDLLKQIPLVDPRSVYDLGCGPGNITRLLAERWPNARIVGVDSSTDMLAKARQEAPRAKARIEVPRAMARMEAATVAFEQADIARWSPPAPADLLFTNATLHWLDDHAALLPRLAAQLAPGGVLAIQMPDNRTSPSHLLMDEAADAGPWRSRLARLRPVYGSMQSPDAYYRMLAPVTAQVDIWETTYLHVLEGDDPVVEWTKGTALRPYLDALEEPERADFLAALCGAHHGGLPQAARRPHPAALPPHLHRGAGVANPSPSWDRAIAFAEHALETPPPT